MERHRGNWLALHDSSDVRETILDLCAQGLPDFQIAEYMRTIGLVDRITPEDVAYYKQTNVTDITSYIEKNAKTLLGKTVRSKRPFRIGELDRLLGTMVGKIYELLDTNPKMAATLMNTYLKGQQQLAVDVGDLQGAVDQKNTWIETLGKLDPDAKKRFMGLLIELDQMSRDAGVPALPDPHVVDVQYEVMDGE